MAKRNLKLLTPPDSEDSEQSIIKKVVPDSDSSNDEYGEQEFIESVGEESEEDLLDFNNKIVENSEKFNTTKVNNI